MDLRENFDRIAGNLPSPVGNVFLAFFEETAPYSKLNRLIDAFQVTLQFVAVILLQNFYLSKLAKEFPEIDLKIRERLSRPTTGDWIMFFRETLSCLKIRKELLVIPEIADLNLETIADKLVSLRNDVRHGVTYEPAKATAILQAHITYLESLLTECEKLGAVTLAHVTAQESDSTTVQPLIGVRADIPAEQKIRLSFPIDHLIAVQNASGKAIDLHPFLIFVTARPTGKQCLFFNSLNKKVAYFLDYTCGDPVRIESPDSLPADFQRQFPRPSAQKGAQEPNWFGEFITNATLHFVGRQNELSMLDHFTAGGSKRVLVLIGPPGVGKTALLAQWAKREVSIRHFIREGDPATEEPSSIFENLGTQLAKMFTLEWTPPATRNPADYRTAFQRLLVQAATKTSAPLVVQLDGLDEAERTTHAVKSTKDSRSIIDWLPESSMIPENVRWILSTRADILSHPAFAAKFGSDKSEHYTLKGLNEANVRELLSLVCSWQELSIANRQIEEIVRRSEGSPLYLRMLIEDISAGRMSLANLGQLPTGIEDFFERILESIEKESIQSTGHETSLHLKSQILLLQGLRDKGDISPQRFTELCKQAREELSSKAQLTAMELLAVFAVAKEPLLLVDAAAILTRTSEQIERAFRIISTVLEEQKEDQYAIFHTEFRNYFRRKRHDVFIAARAHLIKWCSNVKVHHRPYALRHCVGHICDTFDDAPDPCDSELSQQMLEELLTDFEFIILKVQTSLVETLLRDYHLAIHSWPKHSNGESLPQFDPTVIPSWLKECTKAIADDTSVPHATQCSGPQLDACRAMLNSERVIPEYGLLCNKTAGLQIKRGEPARSAGPEIDDALFAESPSSKPTIEAMLRLDLDKRYVEPTNQLDTRLQRVLEFHNFIQFHRNAFTLPSADILVLAFNQAQTGAVADQAAKLYQEKPTPMFRSEVRPLSPLVTPVLFRTFNAGTYTAITSDFQKVISANDSNDGASISITDVKTGELLKRFSANYTLERFWLNLQSPLILSSDGRTAFFRNSIWDLERGCHQSLIDDQVCQAAISADGRLLVTAKQDKNLSLWDAQTGNLVRTLKCEDSEVHQLAISADGRVAAIASHCAFMRLYDTTTGLALLTFFTKKCVRSIVLTPNAGIVVFGVDDNCVYVYSVPDQTLLRRFDHEDIVTAVAVSLDGRIVVSMDLSGCLRVWEVGRGTMLRRIETHQRVFNLQISCDGGLAFGNARIWDLKAGRTPFHQRSESNPTITISISEDNHILAGTADGAVEFWHPVEGAIRLVNSAKAIPGISETNSSVTAVHFENQNNALLAFSDGNIGSWDGGTGLIRILTDQTTLNTLRTEEMINVQTRMNQFKRKGMDPEFQSHFDNRSLHIPTYHVCCAAFSPNGKLLVTAVDGECIRLWKAGTGQCIASLPIHVTESLNQGEVVQIDFSYDGKKIIFITSDSNFHTWDYASSCRSFSTKVFSPDPFQGLATSKRTPMAIRCATNPRRLEIWDTNTPTVIKWGLPPCEYIQIIALSPDDKTLVCVIDNDAILPYLAALDLVTFQIRATYPIGAKVTALSKINDSGRFVCSTNSGDIHILSLQNF